MKGEIHYSCCAVTLFLYFYVIKRNKEHQCPVSIPSRFGNTAIFHPNKTPSSQQINNFLPASRTFHYIYISRCGRPLVVNWIILTGALYGPWAAGCTRHLRKTNFVFSMSTSRDISNVSKLFNLFPPIILGVDRASPTVS